MEKKNENRNGKRPQAGKGQKWQKNGQKMDFWGSFPLSFHFWAIFWPFLPLSSLGPFSISISIFFFHFRLWPFSMPYQPGRIPTYQGIWRSGCPGGVSGTNSGRPRDTWDIWAWFMCKSILKGQNVPGTDGTYHGTDGTCPRDRRDAHQGVSRQDSLCLLVFSFPNLMAH